MWDIENIIGIFFTYIGSLFALSEFQNASMVYICEIMIDTIKHSFIAKFNDIKPIVFSEFLEDLCRQVICFNN